MCFYDLFKFSCGDCKWGHFRLHCNKEYRMGETCGVKIVMEVVNSQQKCRLCDKIDVKQRRRANECDRIARWKKDGGKFRASKERAEGVVKQLDDEILALDQARKSRIFYKSNVEQPQREAVSTDISGIENSAVISKSLSTTNDCKGAKTESCDLSREPQIDTEVEEDCRSDSTSSSSSNDELFSNSAASSTTSNAGTEARAAQDELFLVLSEDIELRKHFQRAFKVMSLDAFEEGFPRIFNSYWTNLSKDAHNDRERNFVRFMRSKSKQHFITRRICESFGPEDNRAATFAKLKKQREERFLLLERFLERGQGPSEVGKDVSCPDDNDELEFFAEYDYSDVRDLKDFLLGNAFTRFQIQMQRFVDTDQDKEKPPVLAGSAVGGSQIVDAQICSMDDSWKPRLENHKPPEWLGDWQGKAEGKEVTLCWQCKCGVRFRENVVQPYPGYADEIVQQYACDADEYDIEKQESSTEGPGTQGSSLSKPTFRLPPSESVDTCLSNLNLDEKGAFKTGTQEASDQGRWILLCLPGKGFHELHHTCVKTARCNQTMYKQLHNRYHSIFRRGIRWLTLHKLESVDFIRFHIYWRNNVNIEASDLGSLPPCTAKDYDFDRQAARPPILRTALAHFMQYPSHAPKGTRHLARMPKKIGCVLEVADGLDEEREGWGLLVHESLCWTKISVAFGLIGVGALIFAIVWCQLHDGSIQDGFTVTGVLLAYGTILMGIIQVVIFQRSSRLI